MINKYFLFIALFCILFIGLGLRLYKVPDIPSGFFADEASIGYNAYSLFNTGKDEYGVSFPVFFQSFGDYRPPLAIYSTILFVAIFGLNELSIRLPSVFYGLVIIFALYYIGEELHSKSFGLLTVFIATTMPWLIHYNRTGFEFTIYAALFVITVLLFLKGIHNKSFIVPAFLNAGLTLYAYQPARLLIPLLLLGLLVIYRKTYLFHKKEMAIGLVLFFLLGLPLTLSFLSGEGFARFNMVSVFSAKLPFSQTVLRIIHNYLSQLSPSLFIIGELTFISRHFIGGLTPLHMSTLPFLFIGFLHVVLKIKEKKSQLLMYWLLIYPIAGAVTIDAPFTSRSIIGAPLFAILISLGIITTIQHFKKIVKNYVLFAILFLFSINTLFFTRFYFTQYPLYSSDFWGWQYGAKDIVAYFVKQEKNYEELIMAPEFNAPEIFFKFYAPNACEKCKVGLPHEMYNPAKKQLFAVTPTYIAKKNIQFKTIKILYYPNSTVAFQIGEIVE